jgi:hypothetical protein
MGCCGSSIPGALSGLSRIELEVELRQMIHHKGTRRIPEIALGDTSITADSLSYHIVSAALEVHKQLGPGLLESACEACLCRELDCGYRLDLIVGELVIVEVKSVTKILPIQRAQVMTYLKLSNLKGRPDHQL